MHARFAGHGSARTLHLATQGINGARSVAASVLRSMLLARIVTSPGSDHEFAVSLRMRFYPDGAVAARALRGRGLISNRVLVADVVRHGAADLVHFVKGAGKERNSPGPLGNCFEGSPRTAGFLFSKQADCVHRGSVLFLQASNRLFQRLSAGVVLSVSHHEQHFLL